MNLDIECTFEKIVGRRRGGWCYEMNGLLGWALEEIGFDVTRLLGGMLRSLKGDDAMGNHPGTSPADFDFLPERSADEDRLALICGNLQDDEDSPFKQNLICMQPDGHGGNKALIGRALAVPGEEKQLLESADELCGALDTVFGLRDPEFRSLWPRVVARHTELFGDGLPDEVSFNSV